MVAMRRLGLHTVGYVARAPSRGALRLLRSSRFALTLPRRLRRGRILRKPCVIAAAFISRKGRNVRKVRKVV